MSLISRSDIGLRLRQLREDHGFSQQQISDVLGIPRQSVSLIENGERDLSATELASFADFLQLSYDEILSPPTVLPSEKDSKKSIAVFDPQKLRNTLLLLLEKIGGKPNIGETVLYKLLYFCDFDHYEKTGKSITGLTYRRLQFGPVPQRNQFDAVIQEMVSHGEMEKISRPYHGKMQVRYIMFTEPDLRVFNERELQTIHNVTRKLSDMSATAIAEYVHGDVPWEATKQLEPIDYDLVYLRKEPYSIYSEEETLRALEHLQLEDIHSNLDPISKDEYEYYESLPPAK